MAARAVPTMPDWTNGQQATSALLQQITTYTRFWANPPMFRMYQSITQSIPNGAFTQITCDSLDYDTDSGRSSTTPYSYTIPVGMSGRWQFSFKVGYSGNATGDRLALLYKNGSAVTAAQNADAAAPASTGTDVAASTQTILVAAGDVIALYAYQNSGGALNTESQSCLEGRLVSLANP